MTAFQYQKIINKYLKEHNIKVECYYKRSHGIAWVEERIIRIPKPVIELNFYICLHEIGHVVTNDINDPEWLGEYKATKYGIEEAGKCGVEYSKEVMECIRGYLKYHLAKAIQTGLAIETIPDKVFRLAGASKRYWYKNIMEGKKPYSANNEVNEFQKWRMYKIKWK